MKIIKKDASFTETKLLKNYTIGPYQGANPNKSKVYISNDSKTLIKTNISKKEFNNLIFFNKKVDDKVKKYFIHDIDIFILKNKKIYFKMIYIKSETLRFTIMNLKFNEIHKIYIKLFKIIFYLNHKHKIFINDIHLDNIIYFNKQIYIIDFLDYITVDKVGGLDHITLDHFNLKNLTYNKMFEKSELFFVLITIFRQFIIINKRITKIRLNNPKKIKKKTIYLVKILNASIKNKKIKNIYELDIFFLKLLQDKNIFQHFFKI